MSTILYDIENEKTFGGVYPKVYRSEHPLGKVPEGFSELNL